MVNDNFWILIGSISTTLAAIAFIALAIYNDKAKDTFYKMSKFGFDEPVHLITINMIKMNIIFFLIPIALSITIISNVNYVIIILIFFLILIFLSPIIHNFLKHYNLSPFYLILSSILVFFLPIFSCFYYYQSNFVFLEVASIFSVLYGLAFSIFMLNYLIKIKSIFRNNDVTSLTFHEKFEDVINEINKILKKLNNLKFKVEDTNVNIKKVQLHNEKRQVENIKTRLDNEYISYTSIMEGFLTYKKCNNLVSEMKEWIKQNKV